MTWLNLRFNVWRSFVAMATNLPSYLLIQFVELLLKFLANFDLFNCVSEKLWLFNHRRADFLPSKF